MERVLVADNIISHTGTDSGYRASCVMLTTEAQQTPPQVNRGIVIRHNRLQSDQPVSILLQDATNVQITDNEFIGGHEIQQHNCTNVTINNNQIKP